MFGVLGNPWVLIVVGLSLVGTHGFAYVQGRSDGSAHERVVCNERIDKANKHAEELGKQWQDGLTAVLEAATKAAGEDDAKNAKLQEELDKYVEQVVAGGGELCLVTDDDANANSLRNNRP